MKAWELEKKILQDGVPVKMDDNNEKIWEEEAEGPESAQDALTMMYWHSQVPGSRAHESIVLAAIQATENKGYVVPDAMDLLDRGRKALEDQDMAELHKATFAIFEACRKAQKDESSPYWNQKFYDSFEEYAAAVDLPGQHEIDWSEELEKKIHAGWMGQIIGGAFGTMVEGYTTDAIYKAYGKVDRYIRKPNTYNDDITYELTLLKVFDQFGKNTTSKELSDEWIARISMGWSAEDMALRNLKCGITPPESGRFNNPFNEWIGAQMRGVVCGQIYPGNPYMAAKAAWMDGEISHARNGILGEVFNAIMASMSFYEKDIKKIITDAVELMPADSEYGQVVRFALEQCHTHEDWLSAWRPCEARYDHYNWIHAYPNACSEIISLWFGSMDVNETLAIVAGCGQDVDCNAAQIMTILCQIVGEDSIPSYWTDPIGDRLDTYVRGMKVLSIKELSAWTAEIARKLR